MAGDDANAEQYTQDEPRMEIVDAECLLIHGLLSLNEQVELCEYIHHNDKTPYDKQPRPMVPAPKTLVLGPDGTHPNRSYRAGEATVVNRFVDKGVAVLKRAGSGIFSGGRANLSEYTSLSMATIRYEAPTGRFPPHVDHCNDSAVFLVSLGRTANFMVKGPGTARSDAPKRFKLYSGDVLVFNASTEANILHGVESIDESASELGEALANRFPVLQSHRYGVQCRMYFG